MTWNAAPPIILDFDGSVWPLAEDEMRIPLAEWQERIRFGCTMDALTSLGQQLVLPEKYGCLFLGSGDYHHISLLPLARLNDAGEPFELIVCDNHPDNMRYPSGVHCGSWIYQASRFKNIRHIHVLGITSGDIGLAHSLENHISPFLSRRLTYWSIGRDASWLTWLGRRDSCRRFDSADELVDAFCYRPDIAAKLYLSIDKDVCRASLIKTNWDQGLFEWQHLERLITACADRLLGADVTGEISYYSYKSLFKRILAGLDGQLPELKADELLAAQSSQRTLNCKIMKSLVAVTN